MSNKQFTEEFKIEAVRQVSERGVAVKKVAARLGVSTWGLYQWIKRYGMPAEKRLAGRSGCQAQATRSRIEARHRGA